MQLGNAVELELFDVAGLNAEKSALAVGFGKLETAGGLLDVISDFLGNSVQDVGGAGSRVEIHPKHQQRDQCCRDREQTAQTVDLERHLDSV